MNITTKIVTTKTHIGSFSADEIKAVALSYATKQAGVTDAGSIVSSKVDIAGDGSVTVEIVEAVAEAHTGAYTSAAPESDTASIVTPGIATPAPGAPSPGFASGFGTPQAS